ncbi:uncharacterized protein LOC135837616 [Planococcus citri]|uniref:uncharacterized protein LOC135837616 n=1 Tax=Planococcus citri TaxID=170843 RepID=UPI0031FA2E36
MRLIFIFGVFILLYCNAFTYTAHPSSKNVLFILDKVNPTEYDLAWLKTRTQNLFSRCDQNGFDFSIKRMWFLPQINTRNSIPTTSESTLRTLLTQLERSPSYSVIYVITNVTTPSDNTPLDDILEKIQIKRTEVNFLIGTQLSSQDNGTDSLKKYATITSVSNGYIMGPESFLFDESRFTDSMYLRLTSLPLEVTLPAVVRKDNQTYCADVDSLADRDRIEALNLDLYETNADMPRTSQIKWQMAVTPLTHTIQNCDDSYYKRMNTMELSDVVAEGFTRKYFDYDYGFSTEEVRYLNETYTRPIHGTQTQLYVSFVDENVEYEFDHFEILFVNGSSYGEKILLQPIPETNLYTGSFLPPNGYFYIQVTINAADRVVNRLSSTAMSAAEGFGEDHRNPIFEYKPTFKLPTSTTSKDNPGFDYYYYIKITLTVIATIVVYGAAAWLGWACGHYITKYLILKYCMPNKETEKRSDVEKAHYRAVPKGDVPYEVLKV